MTARRVVIGLGNRDRGDDAVGLEVARRARDVLPDEVEVVEHHAPVGLLECWAGAADVVVVDAVRSGAAPGSVLSVDATDHPLPPWTGVGGTHAFGLAAAIELARAMEQLPTRLVVVGVEAAGFELGAPMSPAVAAAVPPALDAVVAALRGRPPGGGEA